MSDNQLQLKAEAMKKLQAFNLFREKGMKAVESMFPAYRQFVEERKEKSLREVKNELAMLGAEAA